MFKSNTIIVLFVTLICPPVGLILSLLCLYKDHKNWRIYIFCVAYAFAIFAYCYEPTTDSDLVRYYQYVQQLQGHTFTEALEIGQYGHDKLYAFVWVCWIVSAVNDIHLLPAFSVFCVYYIGLFVTCKFGEDVNGNYKHITTYIVLMLMMISFYSIVNNVRNVCAFSLIGLAVFRDCYQKKRNIITFTFYILPIFLHSSAIVFIIIRLIIRFTGKMRLICSALVLFVPLALNILDSRFSSITSSNFIINIFLSMVNSGNNYFTHTTSAWALTVANSGSEKVARFFYIAFALLTVCIYFKIQKSKNVILAIKNKTENENILSVIDFAFLCSLLTISCVPMVMPEYWRFVSILILFGGGFYILLPDFVGKTAALIIQKVMLSFGSIVMILWIRDLLLYSDVLTTLLRACISNPIVLLILNFTGKSIEIIT